MAVRNDALITMRIRSSDAAHLVTLCDLEAAEDTKFSRKYTAPEFKVMARESRERAARVKRAFFDGPEL